MSRYEFATLLALAVALSGCNQILGIHEGHGDASVDAPADPADGNAGGGGAGGFSGSGGNGSGGQAGIGTGGLGGAVGTGGAGSLGGANGSGGGAGSGAGGSGSGGAIVSATLVASAGTSQTFDTVVVGASSPIKTFTIKNLGIQGSGQVTLSLDGSEFLLQSGEAGDCISGTTALLGGEECNLRLIFKPTSAGARSGSLSFSAAPGGTGSVSLAGAGAIVTSITSRAYHTCALLSDGSVRCWGQNGSGQLGNGSTSNSAIPVVVKGVSSAAEISVGSSHTCARLADATVQCWGGNSSGQLGNGSTLSSTVPVAVSNLSAVAEISAGMTHTCARLSDGSVRCWGENSDGQLGNGSTAIPVKPVTVTGLSTVVQIAAGARHTCARLGDGTGRCWGWNYWGQLGDGSSATMSSAPFVVSSLSSIAGIAGGSCHSCVRLTDGTVRCWGSNNNSELGDGGVLSKSSLPIVVAGLSSVVDIAAGGYHTCARLASGDARCWGDNYYKQIAADAGRSADTPFAIAALSGIARFAMGQYHTCAQLADSTVYCWGDNTSMQLGTDEVLGSGAPLLVAFP